jgi:hypothetical protein
MTYRALDPKQAKDFVIPLDKPIEMIAFWSDYTDKLTKEGPSNYRNWQMTIKSDGTTTGKGGVLPLF